MTELKTLKDFRCDYCFGYEDDIYFEKDNEGYYCEAEDLRQEAIKWIIQDILESPPDALCSWLINRWMKRFNITEEDLK